MGLIKKIVFLILFATYINQIIPAEQLNTAELDQILGGLDLSNFFSPYNTAISQATTALENGDLNDLTSALQTAANIDPDQTLKALLEGGQFSAQNLSAKFSYDQLETFSSNVLDKILEDESVVPDYAKLYSTTGLNDINFENAYNLIYNGINNGDISDVKSALNILSSEGDSNASDPFLNKLANQINTPESQINIDLSAAFSQTELADAFSGLSIKPVFNVEARLGKLQLKLGEDFDNRNVTDIINTLSEIKTLAPTKVTEIFQNNEPFDYNTLSNAGFNKDDIIQITKAAGLSQAETDLYLSGLYETATQTTINELLKDLANKDINSIDGDLKQLKTSGFDADDLFENGNLVSYQALKQAGFNDDQITQIAKAEGLSAADITAYMQGNYTGDSAIPGIPDMPQNTPTINSGTGSNVINNTPAAQEYYNLTEVTKSNLQLLVKQNQLTKSEFSELVANQEANLQKLQDSGTASAEEVTEMQNEIAMSKQVLDDPSTEFAPEAVAA